MNEHIENISRYYSYFYNTFLIHFFNLLFLVIFLLYINWQILIVVLASIIVQVLYNYINFKLNKKFYQKYKYLKDQNKRYYFNIENFINNEIDQTKLKQLLFSLKNNVAEQKILNQKIDLTYSLIDKFNNFINSIITLSIYSLGAYLLISQEIKFGNLIMATTFFGYISNSLQKIISYYFFTIDFNFSKTIYLTFLKVGLIKKGDIKIDKIKKINLKDLTLFHKNMQVFNNFNLEISKNTFIYGPSGSGKSTMYNLIVGKVFPNRGKIMINDFDINNIDQETFLNKIIYLKNLGHVPEKYSWNEIFENIPESLRKIIVEISEKINLDLLNNLSSEKMSSGQIQLINLLILTSYKDKLIILDEVLSHIDSDIKSIILKNIISYICKNNFVICSEHDLSVKNYFNNKINLLNLKNKSKKNEQI